MSSQSVPAVSIPAGTSTRQPARRGAARRAEILLAAENVFLANGYESTSMDDIASKAGASKATMYKYFGSKEGLFEELIRDIVPDIPGGLIESFAKNASANDALVEWSIRLIDTVTTPRSVTLYRLIVAEASRCPELAAIYYRKGPIAARAEIQSLLEHLLEGRKNRHHNLDKVSRVFSSAVFNEVFERALLGLSDDNRDEMVEGVQEAVAMLLQYCDID